VRISNITVSWLTENHYQVRVERARSVIDMRVNGPQIEVERLGRYLADGLDSLLDNIPDSKDD